MNFRLLITNSYIYLLLCLPILVKAQYRFDKIGTKQGLSQSTVLATFQDSKGFLWFATTDGLNRYDGYRFTIFRAEIGDPTSISNSVITCITEDNTGNLWIGTSAGISKFNTATGKFTRIHYTDSGYDLSNLPISGIAYKKGSQIWASIYGRGLLAINALTNEASWLRIASNPSSNNFFNRLFSDDFGNMWVGCANGKLLKFMGEQQPQVYQVGQVEKMSTIINITEDTDGSLLVGTRGNGLFRFDILEGKMQSLYRTSNQHANIITSVARDREGFLWVGTDDGVLLFKGKDFRHSTHIQTKADSDFGLSSFSIQSIFVDKTNNVWIGTWEAGLNVHFRNKSKFTLYRHTANNPQTLLSDKVTSIACETNDRIWLGSSVGLTMLDRSTNTFSNYVKFPIKPNVFNRNDVNFLNYDNDGDLYVGYWGFGFDLRRKGSTRFVGYAYNQGRFGANLTTCTPSFVYPHRMWFGTQGNGLMLFDKVKGVYMSTPELNKQGRLMGVNVNALLEDKAGILWIGTYNSGIISFDLYTRQLHFYRQGRDSNLGSNQITKIIQDSDGQIWVGTAGGGLSLYNSDTDSFGTFTTKEGLPSNTIKGILEDGKKNLWFSTNEGLGQLNTQTMTFKTFGEADGLQGKEFLINAYAQNIRGEMFFGGTSGLNVFHPDSLQESKQVPAIYITGLRLFNKRVEAGEKDSPLQTSILETKVLTLTAEQSVFTLDYLALDYQQSKDNQYAYKLEGFDPDWNYVAKQRNATYTNLNDGTYIFKVKATNNDGVWNEKPTELTIIILPPWYRTWWAFAIYGLLILAALLALRRAISIRERLKADVLLQEREKEQVQELDRLKTNFFTNISHEFRTPLTLIISPLERFFADNSDRNLPEKQAKQLKTIHQNAKKLLSLINQLLDLSKLEAGKLTPEISQNDLIEFLEKLTYSFNGLAEQKQIHLSLSSPIERALVYFDLDIIEKVITNLLSNAFKHTPADGSITVTLTLDRNRISDISRVKIAVKDTGVGMPAAHLSNIFSRFYQISETSYNQNVGSGVGLALCKELIELHRGDITVISKVGEGTTFAINIPVFKGAFDVRWIHENTSEQPTVFPEQASNRAASVAHVDASGEKAVILIAEDNDDLRAYIHDIFVDKFEIIEAENGENALEKALTHIPDLIISDWMMPKMTGVELCAELKLNEKTSHIPIVILTSKSSNDSKMEGLETGADDYITKPFNANLLEVRVTNLLASRRRLRERFLQSTEVLPKEITLNTADEHFLEKSIRMVEENMANPDFDIQALELALKMSNMQLYRKLKGLIGLSGMEFIRTIRLKKALQLLETATYSVAEVAYQVGFNDPSYFARIFKKEYGKAPSEVKK